MGFPLTGTSRAIALVFVLRFLILLVARRCAGGKLFGSNAKDVLFKMTKPVLFLQVSEALCEMSVGALAFPSCPRSRALTIRLRPPLK